MKNSPKIIVILGPTAVGKSFLAVKLAKKFNGEIVSADSRQVYKGMNLGTGKISKEEMEGIEHHLLNVVSPKKRFSVAQYQKLASKAIEKILKKNKIPFLVGGSPFYIYSIVEGWQFPQVKPDWRLRRKLEKESWEKLYSMLKKLDSQRAKNIDKKNKRRLIRAIEIAKKLKRVPKLKKKPKYDCLLLGIKKEKEELKKLIKKRLLKRIKQGMIDEVKKLKKEGLSWKRLEEFGLEYKWISYFLQNKIDFSKMLENLQKDIFNFAKEQISWFKKDKKIHWIKNYSEAKNKIYNFLKSSSAFDVF